MGQLSVTKVGVKFNRVTFATLWTDGRSTCRHWADIFLVSCRCVDTRLGSLASAQTIVIDIMMMMMMMLVASHRAGRQ